MGFGVFIHRSDSIYEDSPAEQYQFPGQYRSRAEACVCDWIVYYEPTKIKASRGYFAIARVQQVIADPGADNMYLAIIEPGSYLEFANPVPFRDWDGVVERGLLNSNGVASANKRSAVRALSAQDFNRIIERGLEDASPLMPRTDDALIPEGLEEPQMPFMFEQPRERISRLSSRHLRDRVFRKIVLRAYDERCAISGLKLINGGGRAEVTAAHIRPVEANGPDSVHNGLALSGTAHWMFDRGLIGLSDDLEIMISRQANDADAIRAFINKNGRAIAPVKPHERPHPHFLQWHRENCFKH